MRGWFIETNRRRKKKCFSNVKDEGMFTSSVFDAGPIAVLQFGVEPVPKFQVRVAWVVHQETLGRQPLHLPGGSLPAAT